jgi:hypothetical protein
MALLLIAGAGISGDSCVWVRFARFRPQLPGSRDFILADLMAARCVQSFRALVGNQDRPAPQSSVSDQPPLICGAPRRKS